MSQSYNQHYLQKLHPYIDNLPATASVCKKNCWAVKTCWSHNSDNGK